MYNFRYCSDPGIIVDHTKIKEVQDLAFGKNICGNDKNVVYGVALFALTNTYGALFVGQASMSETESTKGK